MTSDPILLNFDAVRVEIDALRQRAEKGETKGAQELLAALGQYMEVLDAEGRALLRKAVVRLGQGEDARTVFMPKQTAQRGASRGRPSKPIEEVLAIHERVHDVLHEWADQATRDDRERSITELRISLSSTNEAKRKKAVAKAKADAKQRQRHYADVCAIRRSEAITKVAKQTGTSKDTIRRAVKKVEQMNDELREDHQPGD